MTRMVSEKVNAALEAQNAMAKSMLTGNAAQIPSRTVVLHRRKMRANRRRLGAAKAPCPSRPRRSKRSPLKWTGQPEAPAPIPEEIRAPPGARHDSPLRAGRPIRWWSFFDQLLPVLDRDAPPPSL
jgi:hypothetical protein